MIRSALGKVAWVGRTASMVVGLALVVGLVVGLADAALGANGQAWVLGRINQATATTQLNGNVPGKPALLVNNFRTEAGSKALQLNVDPGKAPLAVNPGAGKAPNLNADKLDGKHATQIGVNGLERVHSVSSSDSSSPKIAQVSCPEGKVLVGTGYDLNGGTSGFPPNELTDVVINRLEPSLSSVFVLANEEDPTSANWSLTAYAMCAKAP